MIYNGIPLNLLEQCNEEWKKIVTANPELKNEHSELLKSIVDTLVATTENPTVLNQHYAESDITEGHKRLEESMRRKNLYERILEIIGDNEPIRKKSIPVLEIVNLYRDKLSQIKSLVSQYYKEDDIFQRETNV